MKFDYGEYYNILFVASVCIFLFALLTIIIYLFQFLKNIPTKFNKKFVSYILGMFTSVFLVTIALFPMKHGVYLIREKESDKIAHQGTITAFKRTYGNNKYVYNGKNTFAQYIFIDGDKYSGDLEIGDEVTFEYLPKSRIILSIEEK